jgi:hypothetical protein
MCSQAPRLPLAKHNDHYVSSGAQAPLRHPCGQRAAPDRVARLAPCRRRRGRCNRIASSSSDRRGVQAQSGVTMSGWTAIELTGFGPTSLRAAKWQWLPPRDTDRKPIERRKPDRPVAVGRHNLLGSRPLEVDHPTRPASPAARSDRPESYRLGLRLALRLTIPARPPPAQWKQALAASSSKATWRKRRWRRATGGSLLSLPRQGGIGSACV